MNVADTFRDAANLDELEGALRARCGSLGRLRRLDLIPNVSCGCVVCRLEPEPDDRDAFVLAFGGSLIGSGLYFDIPHRFEDAR